jgi:uncharacterized protein (DUF58 family)
MNFARWIHRIRRRRTIEVTTSGKWFLTLTIVFGVAAVLSGNAVLYLLESLLLGFLVLSGVLSDRMLWNLSAKWIESPVHAAGPISDRIVVTNESRIPAIAIEFGEWTNRGFEPRGYLPFLSGLSSSEVEILPRPYDLRGNFEWTGRVMATRFPFGFARKIRWIGPDGTRWIRPAIDLDRAGVNNPRDLASGQILGTSELQEGAVRPYLTGDDPRDIAWIYSANLLGPHVQRLRLHQPELIQLTLTEDLEDPQRLEAHLSDLATELVRARRLGAPIELTAPAKKSSEGRRTEIITEIETALDRLARVPRRK